MVSDTINPDIRAAGPQDLDAVRALWREYWQWLGLPGGFQDFENECRTLPGLYAPPRGRLLVAAIDHAIVGTMALRPAGPDCEVKRLYVAPAHRRAGVAQALLERMIAEAREAGYQTMFADTLPTMQTALDFYARAGFVACGPYASDPTPGAVYLRRNL